tara:strand:- start:120 stop:326 length:207 start_codon:yes stop_codon:yes gene_type:complete
MNTRNVNKFLVDFLTHCSGDNFRKWKTIAEQRDVHELHDEYQLALEFEDPNDRQAFEASCEVWRAGSK